MTAITKNLPSFIKDPAVALIGKKCYATLVEELHFGDIDCLKFAVSKALGVAIVLGGSIMKLPQLLLILKAHHARGLSLPAFGLETLAYLITLIYAYRKQFPFSTYGENLFLTIQNVAITLLIIYYFPASQNHLTTKRARSNTPVVYLAAAITLITTYGLLSAPPNVLQLLQMATVPISLFSKVPQISSNYSNQSTGQLSVFAVVSQVLGCAARLFTTVTEVNDPIVLAGFALALALNVILGIQIWLYWGSDLKSGVSTSTVGKEPVYLKEKESVGLTHRAEPKVDHHHHQHLQPSFVSATSSSAASPSTRRWARKVD